MPLNIERKNIQNLLPNYQTTNLLPGFKNVYGDGDAKIGRATSTIKQSIKDSWMQFYTLTHTHVLTAGATTFCRKM